MSCCNRGCEPCFIHFVRTGGHFKECCGGIACRGSHLERMEAERQRERQVANERAKQDIEQTADALERLRVAVATAELAIAGELARRAENARDAMQQLAEQALQEELSAQVRAKVEQRLDQLRGRQQQTVEKQPELTEQRPKVVHVPAAEARPGAQRVSQKVTHQ